jgi:TatD DNase family protein
MLIDTHCHLFYDKIKDEIDRVLKRAEDSGVSKFICVATDLEDAQECINLSEKFNKIWPTAGIHPHSAKTAPLNFEKKLKTLLNHKKIVALGEIGLDYYRGEKDKDIQQKVFRKQLHIAQELTLPIIFHNRESDKDILSILSDFPDLTGVAHCFSSTLETAKELIDMGFYISFSGNLTFKNSHLPDVASQISLCNLLVETDSPYLSPVPYRGKSNEPSRVRYVAEKIAEIHRISTDEVAEITSKNAENLFKFS